MKTRYILFSVIASLIIWLFWGHAGNPDVRVIFSSEELKREHHRIESKPPLPDKRNFSDVSHFQKWQSETRNGYINAVGITKLNKPPEVVFLQSLSPTAGVVRHYMLLTARDGVRVPVVMQHPVTEKELPAIIVIPGHTAPGESGLEQLLDDKESYHHAAASQLAKAGYVTLAIELRGFGLLGAPNYPEHKILAYNQLLVGSSYKALVLSDLVDVLQYLRTLKIADKSRIGVTGASLGGELSVALAAISPEIRSIVFSSYVEQGAFVGFDSKKLKQPHYCHLVPRLGEFMRKDDIFRLLAPRPTMGIRAAYAKSQYADFKTRIGEVWQLFDHNAAFEFKEKEEGRHEFYVDETISFFEENL